MRFEVGVGAEKSNESRTYFFSTFVHVVSREELHF